jgi:hypothetical protein
MNDPLAAALESRGIPAFRTADRPLRAFARWCAAGIPAAPLTGARDGS